MTTYQRPCPVSAAIASVGVAAFLSGAAPAGALDYPVVDTGQRSCYDDKRAVDCPAAGRAFHGQDAQYRGLQPRYVDNGDGTVTDAVTGLMWAKDAGGKQQYAAGTKAAKASRLGGHDDWRVPTIKELYSLMDFTGIDPIVTAPGAAGLEPFLDRSYFGFSYGDTGAGSRLIDSQ